MALYQMRQRDPLVDPSTQAVLERRARELIGLALCFAALLFAVMLLSYSPEDPGWMVASDQPVNNWLGRLGASVASTLMIITGRGAWAIPTILLAWGARFLLHRGAERAVGRVVFALIAVAMASVFAATHVPGDGWAHSFGLGGLFGDTVLGAMLGVAPVKATFGLKLLSLIMGLALLAMMLFVTGFDLEELQVIRHFLAVGSVLTYSQIMEWAGQGTAGALNAASAMQERQRQRKADAQALRTSQPEAHRFAPVNLAPPQPMAVPTAPPMAVAAAAAARRNRVIRAGAEPELPLMPEADPYADYLPEGDDALFEPMPAPMPVMAAPPMARRPDAGLYAPAPMMAPPSRKKEGFLSRFRRAPEPELPPLPMFEDPEMPSDLPPEDRIKARISDVIRSRVRHGMGAAAPQPHMTPLQAAIARREPALSKRGLGGVTRVEPPLVAAPANAAATGPMNAVSAAVASAAARAAAAQAQLAEHQAAAPAFARPAPPVAPAPVAPVLMAEPAPTMPDLSTAPSAAPAAAARVAAQTPAAAAAAAAVAAAIRAGAARAAAPAPRMAGAVRAETPAPLSRPGGAAPLTRRAEPAAFHPQPEEIAPARPAPLLRAPAPAPGVAPIPAPQPARFVAPEPVQEDWQVEDDFDRAFDRIAAGEDNFDDLPPEAGDWLPDDNYEPDFDPTPVVPAVHAPANTAPLRLAPSRHDTPAAAPRIAAPLIAPEVKRGVVQHPAKKPVAPSTRAVAEAQPRLRFEDQVQPDYELPPLSLLSSPSTIQRHSLSDEALEENARMLESVLDDYGVKGEIVSVRPGPVVTMYELEPAPGLKASRVIGLADDIARSMSALSARVSTVPGRSVIGIELPNAQREKVVLREILSAREFGDSAMRLPLALGKDIGGDPVVANLAKMPHLLIAGTTGSGKSVAINTMILSLLYKLTPEECRLIMIDPKMLELSVYDGIPHLLSPVVTDPKKAVVALKWVVGEMEERYRKMSKMGVRNIDGYNGRVREAIANGEMFKRTIQTGFDEDTGEPVFETEEFQPVAIPYIVVIVDEMADLMMVAGKEIEACIQRLAQMARASGIHLIMATQRPSVDVITGTIKANFPTRISFQVTSKIDSRTILGEQGAEQLLGMGDMLYMGNGARITRIHGPFVSDEEVEEIVNHLKSFGPPQYMSGVVEGPEDDVASDIDAVLGLNTGGNTDGEDALYDQAVAIVAKDRKCSTSYIQRKLGIGYNKAARLVEQMEEQGVVTAANHVGKREILIPEA
ncbi:hypothetical protein GCM10011452_13180 [Gemmobacter lanyuensis]|uniref:DNA translocase FtsK n=2 Tax=Gemmobacter lanyuensis TaxID=1054497 RepID=A0A918MIW8_9RHOB|nr:hypothetical protein GCM10011452_13180 [Gemmobacter lanyuensis]